MDDLWQGQLAFGRKDWVEAIARFSSWISRNSDDADLRLLANVFFNVGIANHKIGRFDEARTQFQRANNCYGALGDQGSQLECEYELALNYEKLAEANPDTGSLARAVTHYENVIAHERSVPPGLLISKACNNLALVYIEGFQVALNGAPDTERQNRAIDLLKKSVKGFADHVPDEEWPEWIGRVQNLADALILRGKPEDHKEAVQLYEAVSGALSAATADALEAQRHRVGAGPYWSNRVVMAASKFANPMSVAESLSTLATLTAKLQGLDFSFGIEEAISLNEKALALAGPGNSQLRARLCNNLGNAYSRRPGADRRKDLDSAIAYLEEAVEAHRGHRAHRKAAQSAHNLAAALRQRGVREDLARAETLLREALPYRVSNPYQKAGTLSELAMTLFKMALRKEGEEAKADILRDALSHLEDAARVFTPDRYPVEAARTLLQIGEVRAALSSHTKDASLLEVALHDLDEAEKQYSSIGFLWTSLEPRFVRAAILVDLKRRTEARGVLETGFKTLEALRGSALTTITRRHYLEASAHAYEIMVDLTWEESPDEALIWSERGRARDLADAIETVHRTSDENEALLGMRTRQYLIERQLQLGTLELRERDVLLDQLRKVLAVISKLEPTSPHKVGLNSVDLNLDHVRAVARTANAPLVIIRVGHKGMWLWAVHPSGKIVHDFHKDFTQSSLFDLLLGHGDEHQPAGWFRVYETWRQADAAVATAGPATRDEAVNSSALAFERWCCAMEWHLETLWKGIGSVIVALLEHVDIRSESTSRESVTIIAGQALAMLPLHASRRDLDGRARYLCDDFVITYAPSVMSLAVIPCDRTDAPRTLLAVADPTEDLHFAACEASFASSLFDAGRSTTLGGPSNNGDEKIATVVNLRKHLERGPELLLFSCHGIYGGARHGSGLFLANGDWLGIDGIAGLDLRSCKLAVLSACESGSVNPLDPADNHVGLPGALLRAGSRAVWATQWIVSDISTALVVSRALVNLQRHGHSTAWALWEAERWLRQATEENLQALVQERKDDPGWAALNAQLMVSRSASGPPRAIGPEGGVAPYGHPYYWASMIHIGCSLASQDSTRSWTQHD